MPLGGALLLWARSRPVTARAAALACTTALLLACWAASWSGELVFPTTVQQASHWRARSEAAAAAVAGAPHSAQVVDLVISRFSGNLSWVPGVVALVGVSNVIVYCKARGCTRLCAATAPAACRRLSAEPSSGPPPSH